MLSVQISGSLALSPEPGINQHRIMVYIRSRHHEYVSYDPPTQANSNVMLRKNLQEFKNCVQANNDSPHGLSHTILHPSTRLLRAITFIFELTNSKMLLKAIEKATQIRFF